MKHLRFSAAGRQEAIHVSLSARHGQHEPLVYKQNRAGATAPIWSRARFAWDGTN